MSDPLCVDAILTREAATAIAGTGLAVARWRQALLARGHDLTLITCPEAPPPGEAQAAAQRLRAVRTAFMRELARRWATRRPDLVHIELAGNVGLAALDAATQLGLPTTATFHRIDRLTGSPEAESRVLAQMAAFHRRCSLSVALGQPGAALLASLGVESVAVIGRGVDTEDFHPRWRDPSMRLAWGATPETPVILSVGRLLSIKDPGALVAACQAARARHPALRAVIVGDGPEGPALRAALPWAVFPGVLSGNALSQAYASADIFAFPPAGEPWGNVLLEAAASGLAIVGRPGGAVLNCLAPAGACVLPVPNTVPDFAAAVADLAADPARRHALGMAARTAVLSYTWDAVAERWESAWRDLLKPS